MVAMMLSQVEKCTEFIRNLKIKDVSGSRRKSLVKHAEVLAQGTGTNYSGRVGGTLSGVSKVVVDLGRGIPFQIIRPPSPCIPPMILTRRISQVRRYLRGSFLSLSTPLLRKLLVPAPVSIHSLQSCIPCSSAASLLLKIGPLIRLTSTIEVTRPGRKITPCEYQSKPVAKVGTAEPVIKKSL